MILRPWNTISLSKLDPLLQKITPGTRLVQLDCASTQNIAFFVQSHAHTTSCCFRESKDTKADVQLDLHNLRRPICTPNLCLHDLLGNGLSLKSRANFHIASKVIEEELHRINRMGAEGTSVGGSFLETDYEDPGTKLGSNTTQAQNGKHAPHKVSAKTGFREAMTVVA